MQYKHDLDATKDAGDGFRFHIYAPCCRERRPDHRGWCKTCGTVIAELEAQDAGIPTILRMSREDVAAIQPTWTPRATKARQLGLMLPEQDRPHDWTEELEPLTEEERADLEARERLDRYRHR